MPDAIALPEIGVPRADRIGTLCPARKDSETVSPSTAFKAGRGIANSVLRSLLHASEQPAVARTAVVREKPSATDQFLL